MKKVTKFIAGLSAAAALLLGVSCTNQADYVEDNTALNKMQILGFTVSGLAQSYDQATAKLMVVEKDDEGKDSAVSIGTTTVAKYVSGAPAGYKSGTAYVKFDEPYIFDGDKFHTSKMECYLVVGKDEFKLTDAANGKLLNASLAVKTSPAGTSNAQLAANFVSVDVYNNVPTYSLVKSPVEPFAVPVYMCDFDISSAASAADLPEGVTIDLADKTGTNNKYTVIFKGLTENVGTKFVVAGASISSKDSGLCDNWNIMESAGLKVSAVVTDKGLISEVDKDGTVKFEFYGAKPSWASNASPAIKIAAYNVDTDPWTSLLCANGGNWFFPDYTEGHDVTMTVEIDKLDTKSWKKSEASYKAVSFEIVGIKVINAPTPKTDEKCYIADGDDDNERILWVPENAWGRECHSYTSTDINAKGTYSWVFDTPVKFAPNAEKFKLSARICSPEKDGDFWKYKTGSYTVHYNTTEFANKKVTLVINGSTGTEYLMLSSEVDYEFQVTLNKLIVNKAITGVELIGGFNGWADSGTIAGTVVGETTEFNISSIAAANLGQIKIRTVGAWGQTEIGGDGPDGNIVLPSYSKTGKVNIVCEYTSGSKVDSCKLQYVN